MIDVRLPLPPSTNAIWRKAKHGMIKSAVYRAWIDAAGWQLKAQRPASIFGPSAITLLLPSEMRGDADNRIKAASDLLVTHRLIDDAKARRIVLERDEDIEPKTCRIIVEAV